MKTFFLFSFAKYHHTGGDKKQPSCAESNPTLAKKKTKKKKKQKKKNKKKKTTQSTHFSARLSAMFGVVANLLHIGTGFPANLRANARPSVAMGMSHPCAEAWAITRP
jgi:hypothetical protein